MLSLLLRTSSASPSCCRSSLLAFCVAEYVQVPLADLLFISRVQLQLGYIRQPSGCSADHDCTVTSKGRTRTWKRPGFVPIPRHGYVNYRRAGLKGWFAYFLWSCLTTLFYWLTKFLFKSREGSKHRSYSLKQLLSYRPPNKIKRMKKRIEQLLPLLDQMVSRRTSRLSKPLVVHSWNGRGLIREAYHGNKDRPKRRRMNPGGTT